MECVKKQRDMTFATTKEKMYYLLSEPNYHTKVVFFGNAINRN